MTDRFELDETRLADIAERYPVQDDHSALLALETAILGDGPDTALIHGPCDIAAELLADADGKLGGYRILIHPASDPADSWIASNIAQVGDRIPLDEPTGDGGIYDTAEIIRDAVKTANGLLAWSEYPRAAGTRRSQFAWPLWRDDPGIALAKRIEGILGSTGFRRRPVRGPGGRGAFLVTPGAGCVITWENDQEGREVALAQMSATLSRAGLAPRWRGDSLHVPIPPDERGPVYEGFVRAGDDILSMQCAEDRHAECPDQTADDDYPGDDGPLGGYYCTCLACPHGPYAARPLLARALAWLARHPDAPARQITLGISEQDHRLVFHLLDQASRQGQCQRKRTGGDPWRWSVPPQPNTITGPA